MNHRSPLWRRPDVVLKHADTRSGDRHHRHDQRRDLGHGNAVRHGGNGGAHSPARSEVQPVRLQESDIARAAADSGWAMMTCEFPGCDQPLGHRCKKYCAEHSRQRKDKPKLKNLANRSGLHRCAAVREVYQARLRGEI